jgi:FtsZ-interacting cell division protein ZipA
MLKDLFVNQPFWQQLIVAFIATGLVALIGFLVRFMWRKFRRHSQSRDANATKIDSPTQVAKGRGITQKVITDKSRGKIVFAPVQSKTSLKADTFEKPIFIEAESGATVNIINRQLSLDNKY